MAEGPETASEILLDCLLKSDEPGWYQTFLEALRENGNLPILYINTYIYIFKGDSVRNAHVA